jgi:hypothetical protein
MVMVFVNPCRTSRSYMGREREGQDVSELPTPMFFPTRARPVALGFPCAYVVYHEYSLTTNAENLQDHW